MSFKVKDFVSYKTNGQEMVVIETKEKVFCRWMTPSGEIKKEWVSECELDYVDPDKHQLPQKSCEFKKGDLVRHITGGLPLIVKEITEKGVKCAREPNDKNEEIFFQEELESDEPPFPGIYISRLHDEL